jgi:hypothetical protein
MSYLNLVDESVHTEHAEREPSRPGSRSGATRPGLQRTGHPDHTNSGGFCSCCGVVYPCRAARSAAAAASQQ